MWLPDENTGLHVVYCRGRPRKIVIPVEPELVDPDTDDDLALDVDTDQVSLVFL